MKPAFIYFALSGKDSLNLDPYNQPIQALKDKAKCFSWDLPFHHEGADPVYALKKWNEAFERGEDFLTPYLEEYEEKILKLIRDGDIDKEKICLAGLSRGGFVALNLARRLKFVKKVVAFAPLTNLHSFQGEATFPHSVFKKWNLIEHLDELLHKKIRLYIGNLDERVQTDYAYELIRGLAKKAHEEKMRHFEYELVITPSIGHRGHGTTKQTFTEGALWGIQS